MYGRSLRIALAPLAAPCRQGNKTLLGGASVEVRLNKFHVIRYRSLRDTTFEPNAGLSVLIGPNGVGKTNLLQSLLLLRGGTRRGYGHDDTDESAARISLEASYSVDQDFVSYKLDLNAAPGETGPENIAAARERWSITTAQGPLPTIELPVGLIQFVLDAKRRTAVMRHLNVDELRNKELSKLLEQGQLDKLAQVFKFNSTLRYYSASHFTDPTKCPSSFEVEGDNELVDEYSSRGAHRNFLYGLFSLYKKDEAAYEQLMDIVGKNGIKLVSDIRWKTYALSSSEVKVRQGGNVVRRKRRRTLVIPKVKVGQSTVAFNQLSDGTFKSLALIFYLMNDDWSMLLLEEPEVCVHHGLLTSLVELIKARSKKRQIVVSTHSEFVLDLVASNDVFPVSSTNTGTHVKRLDKSLNKKALTALVQYLQTSGNLGEYWKHGGLDV